MKQTRGKRVGKAFDFAADQPWAILPESLETILSIAGRYNDDPEAVAAKIGRPLNNTRTVSMRGDTAVIPVHGPIFRYANLFTEISGATSIEVMATDLQKAMDELPENCEKVFKMSRISGMKNKEIASKLNISVRTVETQIYRALKVLREKLKNHLPSN